MARRMWVESMGVASGCGCKKVYRFPHTTYPYSSLLLLYLFFLQQHPYFSSFCLYIKNEQNAAADTRGVGIRNMRVYI